MVVHFPIALLLSAVLIDLGAVLWKRPAWHRIGLWNLGLGTLGAGAAVWTGLRAAGVAKHSFEIYQIMERHEQLGIATLTCGSLIVLWRLWTRDRVGNQTRLLMMLAMCLTASTLAYGAHLGGRLVYEFGVGGAFGTHP